MNRPNNKEWKDWKVKMARKKKDSKLSKVELLNKWLVDCKFVKDHSKDLHVVKCDEFAYEFYGDAIYYTDDLSGYPYFNVFLKHFKKKCRVELNYDPRTIAFLHELGHSQTWDNGNDLQYWIDTKVSTMSLSEKPGLANNIKNFIYLNSPMERKATEWAILYIYIYADKVEMLDKIIRGE